MRIIDGKIHKDIEIKGNQLDALVNKYQLKTIDIGENEQGKIIGYGFNDEYFLIKYKNKNKWAMTLSLDFIDAKVLKRDFFKMLGINYTIKPLSNIATEKMIETNIVDFEETIYAPDECRISNFYESDGMVSFIDYVEDMDIEDKYFKYNIGALFLYKEAFFKDKNGKIIYRYPNNNPSMKYEASSRMNLKDVRYIGRVTDVKYERYRKMVKAIYKVEVEK